MWLIQGPSTLEGSLARLTCGETFKGWSLVGGNLVTGNASSEEIQVVLVEPCSVSGQWMSQKNKSAFYPQLPMALDSLITMTGQSKRKLRHKQVCVRAMSLDLREQELSESLLYKFTAWATILTTET